MVKHFPKALLLQGLFFWASWSQAQSLSIVSPKPGDPLLDRQVFNIQTTGEAPSKVQFYLNGTLVAERTEPPFSFEVDVNPKLEQTVVLVGEYRSGPTQRIETIYPPFQADVQANVSAFQCFPFFERDIRPNELRFRSGQKKLKPERFEPADRFLLQAVIALDVSGSMRHALADLTTPIKALLAELSAKNASIKFVLFDKSPRLTQGREIAQLPSLETLFRGVGSSAIWDTLATAATLFEAGPRRMVFLISDGADDGSSHDHTSVQPFLASSGAALIWLNPTPLQDRVLTRTCKLSGGFTLTGENPKAWDTLLKRLNHQYHLQSSEANFPIRLEVRGEEVFYPRWSP